jgi:hypothetical protein
MTDSAMENAELMIETFTKGLADGVKHFDKNGKELKTVREILETLQAEGNVAIEFPKDQAPPEGLLKGLSAKPGSRTCLKSFRQGTRK